MRVEETTGTESVRRAFNGCYCYDWPVYYKEWLKCIQWNVDIEWCVTLQTWTTMDIRIRNLVWPPLPSDFLLNSHSQIWTTLHWTLFITCWFYQRMCCIMCILVVFMCVFIYRIFIQKYEIMHVFCQSCTLCVYPSHYRHDISSLYIYISTLWLFVKSYNSLYIHFYFVVVC